MQIPRSLFLGVLAPLTAATAHAQVSVQSGKLTLNGRPWVPHGIVQIAFVAPPAAQQGVFADAYQHYSPHDYEGMRRHGIDSVRIQVSQPGLDPQNALFTPAFRSQVTDAVHAARAAGLMVMLSVQDEVQSGETKGVASLPNHATNRVWQTLAPIFAQDQGVMYELLNEPNLPASPANWLKWADAMNATLAVVRQSGARNVVVADGLQFAERLSGAPDLKDHLGQVIYASHPYAHRAEDQQQPAWDAKFGDFARRHPVVVTEGATVPKFFCDLGTPRYTEAFLHYLDERGIGLMAYGWGLLGTEVRQHLPWLPSPAHRVPRAALWRSRLRSRSSRRAPLSWPEAGTGSHRKVIAHHRCLGFQRGLKEPDGAQT